MKRIFTHIIDTLKETGSVDDHDVAAAIRQANRGLPRGSKPYAKRQLSGELSRIRTQDPRLYESWNLSPDQERSLEAAIRLKPRRTSSGVATITVITKPHPCSSHCLYCPNDVRMPKSYLADEPACQRAEQNFFDPYLQVANRLKVLRANGHPTDKVELIILGGTWTEYPVSYQDWFMRCLYAALNDAGEFDPQSPLSRAEGRSEHMRKEYLAAGMPADEQGNLSHCQSAQQAVNAGQCSYNQAIRALYGKDSAWNEQWTNAQSRIWTEDSPLPNLAELQRINTSSLHRVVGLVVETRPDAINPESLIRMRSQGVTKVQIGIQSLNQQVLDANNRSINIDTIAQAFELLRLFGYKIHAHYMVNLASSTPEMDTLGYRTLVRDPRFQPDEIKLYPCALIEGTELCRLYQSGQWQPYSETQLVEILSQAVLDTPAYCRVSRMIRDFCAQDIVAGNRKANLRQMVESNLESQAPHVQEIRFREIAGRPFNPELLSLNDVTYTTSVSTEHFLQWVTPEGRIAGFLRLSLPRAIKDQRLIDAGIRPDSAMIREVHVYGQAARIHSQADAHAGLKGSSAQHSGLGTKLVERACKIASDAGYASINVISAIGTKGYYQKLGFNDNGLYQNRPLT